MFKTLNNDIAKHIIICALNGQVRFCAYSLYNHYHGNTFDKTVFDRLYMLVLEFLGPELSKQFFTNESIDFCVRDFINRYYGQIESRSAE